ncbi:MAG: hypothetical protein KBS74_01540 [Clostridiales bacterium]|nr:hypothetical protein [Candidatus Cacconaster stercorequi]
MGKRYVNHYTDLTNEYTKRERDIKKAKGNPNKNKHQKKNGSNYQGAMMAKAIADKAAKQEHVKLPKWLYIVLGILFAGILVTLILRMTLFKTSLTLVYLSSLFLGVTCGVLFYTRRFFRKQKKGTLYSVISILLMIACLYYTTASIVGLTGILN